MLVVALMAFIWGFCTSSRQDTGICSGSFSIESDTDWERVSDCRVIEGNLFLDDSTDGIMRGDMEIEEIAGNLIVSGVGQARSLEGFSGLIRIGGDLEISKTIHLKKMAAFEKLASIGGSLTVKDNWSLKEIAGLENLVHIGGDLKIVNNESLERVGRNVKLKRTGGAVEIESNRRLVELGLTKAIEEIGGYRLVVRNCDGLKDMAAWGSVRTVKGRIEISSNKEMTSLVGLENLRHVDGPIVLRLPSLIELESISAQLDNGSKRFVIAINGLEELERSVDEMKRRFLEAGKQLLVERSKYTEEAESTCIEDEPKEM
jgi:hypothetical protein